MSLVSCTFIHLNVHTEYSLSDGLIRIEELVKAAVTLKMPAVAVTDQSNLFAAIKFYQAAVAAGIKPILGADCYLENLQDTLHPFRLTLLCQNQMGYKNLIKLITQAYLQGQTSGKPSLSWSWLTGKTQGLFALLPKESNIGQALLQNNTVLAAQHLQNWLLLFPTRFYFQVQRTGKPQEETYIALVSAFAQQYCIPIVASNEVCFLSEQDYEAHEARVCIHEGTVLLDPRRPRRYSAQQYLRSPQEMAALFVDLPSALTNSVELAKRCNVELSLGRSHLPRYSVPDTMTAELYLTHEAERGLTARLANSDRDLMAYSERLARELSVINGMGFASYFLIVADFIRWAKHNDIPVGPGRGSGAGSLVAYALEITDVDPLQYDLLFERFLNPERISMPDFDIDFCVEGRDRVIHYVIDRYGRESVAQIITYGTMAAKAVVRDVGRVLAYPYPMVDKLAKLIPFELGITLDNALTQEELQRRYQNEEGVRHLFDLARKLEGLVRNAGKHAGGVVIAPKELIAFTPLYCEPGETTNLVTQFDKDDIEQVGLVKFDLLGLKTLTIIRRSVETINQQLRLRTQEPIQIDTIDLHDPMTFALLKACKTRSVFQLESRGMRDLVRRLQPDCMDDIVALVALFRPGPLQSGMVDEFIDRKQGKAKITYIHPALEPILRSTYGIILYQEQVMQIAQVLAGYTLGAADLLRRAMGKKKPKEMKKHRKIFIKGADERGIAGRLANQIFDLMEHFADYGFNKSHSVAYALIAYQTAWLKANFPAAFMASVLSADMDHTEKIVELLHECRALGLPIVPPNINVSHYFFTVDAESAIVYGLGALKGLGASVIDTILAERENGGCFKDLWDLCRRVERSKISRRAWEVFVRSGSFDCFNANRAQVLAELEPTLKATQASLALCGQGDLFGDEDKRFIPVHVMPWSDTQRLHFEREILGFYLSGHPLEYHAVELKQLNAILLSELAKYTRQTVITAGWIVRIKTFLSKKAQRMAVVRLEDRVCQIEMTLFGDVYRQYHEILAPDKLLIIQAEVSGDSVQPRLLAKKIWELSQARAHYARGILIYLQECTLDRIEQLRTQLRLFCPGVLPVVIEYQHISGPVRLNLGSEWKINPSDECLQAMQQLLGSDNIKVIYV